MIAILRRAWLVALAVVAVAGAAGALAMRVQLFAPGGTLGAELYGKAFSLHSVAMIGALVAAWIALPTLILTPGRGAVALGGVAFVGWTAAVGSWFVVALYPDPWSAQPLRTMLVVLGAAVALAVVQVVVSLRTSARPRSLVGLGATVALVIVAIPLLRGAFPDRIHLLLATTLAACSVIPLALEANASMLVWIAVVPPLAAAWLASAALEAVHVDFPLGDTVAAVAPLPALGAAVLAALFVAAAPGRRAVVAATIFAVGSIATSTGFLLLGLRGMPRRYQQYDPVFQPLQVVIGVATFAALAGAIAWFVRIRGSGDVVE
ncbi:MAG TPA: hypothetical protein VIV58_24695 [Kofleriaceae bacterium]